MHRGADAPTVRLRWVYTDQPFLPVDTQCVINNRSLNEDEDSELTVGQFAVVIANYKQDARWVIPPDLPGDHICSPEYLAVGEPWPNDLPPTVYDSYQFPVCCGRPTDYTLGGLGLGGEVGDQWRGLAVYGGVELGGEVGDLAGLVDSSAGGVELGGEVGDLAGLVDASAGGVELGGDASASGGTLDALRGGVGIVIAVGDRFSAVNVSAGGVDLGGEVGDFWVNVAPLGGGGVELGGEVGDLAGLVDSSAGGVELGGEVGDLAGLVDSSAGGVELGGEVAENFLQVVTPGNPCAAAIAGTLGIQYAYDAPAGTFTGWVLYTVPNGTYTITQSHPGLTFGAATRAYPAFVSCAFLGLLVNCIDPGDTVVTVTTGQLMLNLRRGSLADAGRLYFKVV